LAAKQNIEIEGVVTTKRKQRILVMLQNGAINKDYRVKQEIFTLLDEGFDVSLVCPASSDGVEWRHQGVKTYYFAPAPDSKGVLSYFYEYLYSLRKLAKLSWRVYRETGFDVIHACNPPDFFFLLAMFYKPLGRKFIYDQHDLAPELYLSRFLKPSRILYRALLLMEYLSYKLADAVITTNNSYREVAITRGRKDPAKVGVVRNGPYYDGTFSTKLNPDLKKGRPFMACYIGEVSPQDGAEYLVKAAYHLIREKGHSDVTFNIVGSGASLDLLKKMVKELNIGDYVFFPGWISEPTVLYEYLVTADICISPEPRNPLNDHSSFIKVLDYMAASKPIVAFDLKETKVTAGDSAVYATPNDERDFAEKICMLLDSREMREKLGRIGRSRIDNSFNWSNSKANLVELYRQVVGVRAGAVNAGDTNYGHVNTGNANPNNACRVNASTIDENANSSGTGSIGANTTGAANAIVDTDSNIDKALNDSLKEKKIV
jgi:glycosyltransferase involved in cell wall biosynthesis